MMRFASLQVLLMVVWFQTGVVVAASPKDEKNNAGSKADATPVDDPAWLQERLEKIRAQYDLPDLGAVLVKGDRVIAASVVGVRKYGTEIKATQDDPFHLGSITKVMTAALIGMMVDDGLLTWDTTMEEMFPELVSQMQPGYRKVTVLQLLSHTGGFPYGPSKSIHEITAEGNNAVERRYGYVKAAIADPLAYEPGKGEAYSGGGIVVMSYIERKLGTSYEQLMQERIFNPLGMTTAGIADHMASEGKVDAPWGHRQTDGKTVPSEPDQHSPVNGRQPVGGVYVSLPDMGKYLAWQLKGGHGQCELLKPETFQRLQTAAPGTGFAPGWIAVSIPDQGKVLFHNGSIGIHVANTKIALDQNYAIATGTNAAGEPRADKALDAVMKFLELRIHRDDTQSPADAAIKTNPVPAKPDIWLDGLQPVEATVGFGKFEIGSRDGGDPLTLNGDVFSHGLGVHANSLVTYHLRSNYKRFVGRAGPEERAGWKASVIAQVYIDNELAASSPVLRAGDAPWNFDVPIPAKMRNGKAPRYLRLVMTDGGDGINSDSADWVDAGFLVKKK